MKLTKSIMCGLMVVLVFGLILTPGCTKKEVEEQSGEQAETQEMEKSEPEETEQDIELPEAVLKTIEENVPNAEIDSVEVGEESGFTLYDIEFKDDRGEIEMTEDGTVLDVVTIITVDELPEAAAEAIKKATEGMTIKRLEKSEIRSEIKKEGEEGIIVKLETPRYEYEAELVKDDQTGEITVDAEGNIVEALKWDTN